MRSRFRCSSDATSGVDIALLALGLITGYVALAVSVAVNQGAGFGFEISFMEWAGDVDVPWLGSFMTFTTHSAEMWLLLPVAAVFFWLWRRGETSTGWLLWVSAAVGSVVGRPLKAITDRPRPEVFTPLVFEPSSSFPSGHTLAAVGVYGFIAVVLWQRGHKVLGIISALWMLLVGFSRVYLGVHYPTDIVASLLAGSVILIGLFAIDTHLKRPIAGSDTVSDTVAS